MPDIAHRAATTPAADPELAHEAIALVRRWLHEAAAIPVSGSASE